MSNEELLLEAKAIADMKSLATPTVNHLAVMQARIELLERKLKALEPVVILPIKRSSKIDWEAEASRLNAELLRERARR